MIPLHAIMSFFAIIAGFSIGAWVSLFFDTFRAVFAVCVVLGTVAALMWFTANRLLGGHPTVDMLTAHVSYWIAAFAISVVVFYFLRPAFS